MKARDWIKFFIGTPQRLLASATAIGLIVVIAQPGLLRMAVERLIFEINPLIGPAVQLLILFFVFRLIFRSLIGGGSGKRR